MANELAASWFGQRVHQPNLRLLNKEASRPQMMNSMPGR